MSDVTTASADSGTAAPNLTAGIVAGTSDANTTDASTDNQEAGRTFTQADINRILARETAKAVKAALTAKEAEAEEANKSELQKLQDAIKATEERAQQAEAKAQEVVITNALTVALAGKVRNVGLLVSQVDMSAMTVENGAPVGLDAELKRLKAEYPDQFYSTTADGGARSDNTSTVTAGFGRLQSAYANSPTRRK